MSTTKDEKDEVKNLARFLFVIVVLGGISLIVLSHFPMHHWKQDVREIVKELGITLFAVGSISLVYEKFLFDKHSKQFIEILRAEVRKGEGNASACAHLGIEEIYAERWKFTKNFSIDELMLGANASSVLRIFARSAHNLMSEHVHVFTAALRAGAHIQLCILDPKSSDAELELTVDVTRLDLDSARGNLGHQLAPTLKNNDPKLAAPGHLEVRYHRIPMLDSFLDVDAGRRVCAWDLSFGRPVELKHIIRVDPDKPLGQHLLARYQHVWKYSTPAYEWKNGVETNNL